MKNFLRVLFVTCFLVFGVSAQAATVYFSPSSVSVAPGQSITVTLVADPQGTNAYTAKISVSFPPNLVYVTSFSQASGWLPLNQPGYDETDNATGSLIKTAGVTGGFSAPKVFGTITFVARAIGTANITVTGATQILNSSNQNTFTSGGQAVISVSQLAPSVATPPASSAPTPNPKPKTNSVRYLFDNKKQDATTTITASSTVTSATSGASTTELTAVASSAKNLPALSIIIPILALILGFFLGQRVKVQI